MREFRLIVASSREYDDAISLRVALDKVFGSLPGSALMTVVHAAHREQGFSGEGDRIAQRWALEMMNDGLPVEQHAWPADWEGDCRDACPPGHREDWRGRSVCPSAAAYRNEEVCATGADGALVALRVGTKSTIARDCLLRLARSGIPFELLIQGEAAGLPRDLIEQAGRP